VQRSIANLGHAIVSASRRQNHSTAPGRVIAPARTTCWGVSLT